MKKRQAAFIVILVMLFSLAVPFAQAAGTNTLTLPADTVTVDAQAFYGSGAVKAVLPDGCTTVNAGAFAGMPNLELVVVPASVTYIAPDAFSASPNVCLQVKDSSYALTYAKENEIKYVIAPVYRAFAVAQVYSGQYLLHGTVNDRNAIGAVLRTMTETPYSITNAKDLTGSGIINGIAGAFAGAKENDVSLFYYSGHGGESGSLIGTNLSSNDALISPQRLRTALDRIPGKKIIIVDACYSGGLVGNSDTQENAEQKFVNGFLSAFGTTRDSDNLAANNYYVLVACSGSEVSFEVGNGNGVSMGIFTYALTSGCGWDESESHYTGTTEADTNNDGAFTLSELYRWTAGTVSGMGYPQTTTCYPYGSEQVLFAK